jgi:hypothetical protein
MPKLKRYTGVTITIDLTDTPYYLKLCTIDSAMAAKNLEWANGIKQLIRRRVDELGDASICAELASEEICESCKTPWTEDSNKFNGGCCDDDMLNEPDTEQEDAPTPIGKCPGCGTPVYTDVGFCGVCGRR